MTYDSHFEVHVIKNKSKNVITLSEYINATCLHLTGFYFGSDSKLVLR